MIETYLLEQLDAFKRCGTLSKAAEELHLSQPSLSRSMQKLEEIVGATLFERQKNKLVLNENGELAAEYASRILAEELRMINHIQALDKCNHSVSVGSVAPGPLMDFVPNVMNHFPDMTVTSETKSEDELFTGMDNDTYQFVILEHPISSKAYHCQPYITENLYVVLPKTHHYSKKEKLYFRELNGESFLMVNEVGIWDKVVRENMPDSHFLMQNDTQSLGELLEASTLPGFATNITLRAYDDMSEEERDALPRVFIPLADDTASIEFFLVAKRDLPKRYLTVMN